MASTVNGQVYDVRTQSDLLGALIERAKEEITDSQKVAIQVTCRNQRFNHLVQFSPFDADHPTMTMKQLAELGINDPGIQRVDPRSVERLLFGRYGLLKHPDNKDIAKDAVGKIGERPTIVYFDGDGDIGPDKPANASGRHRNFAWQILGLAAGVPWDTLMEQPIWVDKTVARTKCEYTMMMVLANGQQARKQPPIEQKSFALTAKYVSIADVDKLVSTRFNSSQGQMGDVIATGVAMSLPSTYTGDESFVFDRIKSAWTKTDRLSPDHRQALRTAFREDGDKIKELLVHLGEVVVQIIEEESERNSAKAFNTRVVEGVTDAICNFFGLEEGLWLTDAQEARKKLENLTQRQESLRAFAGN